MHQFSYLRMQFPSPPLFLCFSGSSHPNAVKPSPAADSDTGKSHNHEHIPPPPPRKPGHSRSNSLDAGTLLDIVESANRGVLLYLFSLCWSWFR